MRSDLYPYIIYPYPFCLFSPFIFSKSLQQNDALSIQPHSWSKTLLHPGDYLDTYFRLLREDCISAIRQSIADVRDRGKNADKAKADGNVFNAKLKGVTVGKGDIAHTNPTGGKWR